ncbi:MAG: hypothetical protein AAF959_07670 [Cyanobacteria bacterium P01_D01_bin.56]
MSSPSAQAKFHVQEFYNWTQKKDTFKSLHDEAFYQYRILTWKIQERVWSNPDLRNETQRNAKFELEKFASEEVRQAKIKYQGFHSDYCKAKTKALYHEGMKMCFLAEIYEKVPGHVLPYEQQEASWETPRMKSNGTDYY